MKKAILIVYKTTFHYISNKEAILNVYLAIFHYIKTITMK